MSNKSLYSINEEQLKLINEIEQMEGELTPEMEQKLTINKADLNQKSIAYLEVISQKQMRGQFIDSEIKRLQALKKRENNVVDRLKDNLLIAVKTFGKFEVGAQTFGTRKSTSVIVDKDKINKLPNKYKTVKVTETANKTAIKQALEEGEEIDGCKLSNNLSLKIN